VEMGGGFENGLPTLSFKINDMTLNYVMKWPTLNEQVGQGNGGSCRIVVLTLSFVIFDVAYQLWF